MTSIKDPQILHQQKETGKGKRKRAKFAPIDLVSHVGHLKTNTTNFKFHHQPPKFKE